MKPYTDVAAALVWDGDRFLICRRPAHKSNALLWEFVGGKAEPGETLEETLIRECREELAITVEPREPFMQVMHTYPDITVRLTLFNAVITEGEPQMLEHSDLRWITPAEIPEYDFCPADKDILREIMHRAGCLPTEAYKIGMSIAPRAFDPLKAKEHEKRLAEEFGGMDAMLRTLKEFGVTHIELRTVSPTANGEAMLAVAERIWMAGLKITVHGSLPKTIGRFAETYPSLLPILREAKAHQDFVNITVHAYSSDEDTDVAKFAADTNRILTLWAEDAERLRYRLALENNRSKEDYDPGNSCEGVLEMLPDCADLVGSCFDFGHYYYNMLYNDDTPDKMPPEAFLNRAFHTHIHALCEKKTHFPLVEGSVMPLERYVKALKKAGYKGVFNMEINVERFPELPNRETIITSLQTLRAAVEQ